MTEPAVDEGAPSRRSAAKTWVFAIGGVVLVLVGRGVVEGSASIHRCDERLAAGDVDAAIAYAMRATKWYVPGAPHVRDGYDRLRGIARKAEGSGDADTALIAWEAIRAGARGTRSLWTPFDDRLTEADNHIAALLAAKPPPGVDRDKPYEQRVQEHLALLATSAAPKPAAVVVLYLGLAAWLVGAWRALGALQAYANDASKGSRWSGGRRGRVVQGLVLAALGVTAFLAALARA